MIQNLLIYCWGSLSEPILYKTLKRMGQNYITFSGTMKNYHADAEFAQRFIACIHERKVDAVFSYDYFPLLSMICGINRIPYISWIYDCPQYTLQSETVMGEYNYIFCFDRKYANRLIAMGAKHCYHLPLAIDEEQMVWMERTSGRDVKGSMATEVPNTVTSNAAIEEKYICDISFVGNFYNDSKNRVRNAGLSPYTQGFVEALVRSQLSVYGYNFLNEALPEQVVSELVEKCELRLGNGYLQDDVQMAADAIGMEVTAREREAVVKLLGQVAEITLYTTSELPTDVRTRGVTINGFADYETEVPLIFRDSRINLNITSRTIESGIPQRVLDVLNCGGFCLTNYQPEVAEYFVDGQDLVMYSSFEDLVYKVQYYLENEEERAQIARNGQEKVRKAFALSSRINEILQLVESGL